MVARRRSTGKKNANSALSAGRDALCPFSARPAHYPSIEESAACLPAKVISRKTAALSVGIADVVFVVPVGKNRNAHLSSTPDFTGFTTVDFSHYPEVDGGDDDDGVLLRPVCSGAVLKYIGAPLNASGSIRVLNAIMPHFDADPTPQEVADYIDDHPQTVTYSAIEAARGISRVNYVTDPVNVRNFGRSAGGGSLIGASTADDSLGWSCILIHATGLEQNAMLELIVHRKLEFQFRADSFLTCFHRRPAIDPKADATFATTIRRAWEDLKTANWHDLGQMAGMVGNAVSGYVSTQASLANAQTQLMIAY